MAKAEIKTKQNESSVDEFLDGLADEQQRDDTRAIVKLMEKATGEPPKMWGPSIVGFGFVTVTSKAKTARTVDWLRVGIAPRKGQMSLYLTCDLADYADELSRLGKHKTGKGCLYIKRLADVNVDVLDEMISRSLTYTC
jgi:hypothetical protein